MALIDKASLLMVPSTYEDGTLYNVLPSGNKAPDKTGNHNGYDQTRADFTFSRGFNLTATRVNANGLIEKGRENLFTNSNTLTGVTLDNLTRTTGHADPFGGNNAALLTENTSTGTHRFYIFSIPASDAVHTYSIYAKPNGRSRFQIVADGGGINAQWNISTGTLIGDSNEIKSNIEDIGDGWYRLSLTYYGAGWIGGYFFNDSGSNSYTGDGTSGVYVFGAQVELGLVSTPYIETGATTATAGVLENTPRIDYSSGAGALLLEPQRTNSVTSSEYLGDSSWAATRMTQTPNQTTSPEGLQNATLIANTTDTGGHSFSDLLGSYTNAQIAVSCYVKKKDSDYFQIGIYNSSTKWAAQKFNIATGEILGSGNTGFHDAPSNVDIKSFGDGWYRVEATFTTTLTGASENLNLVCPYDDSNPTGSFGHYNGWTGSTSENAYVYGVQAEASSSYPSSYVPTYGSAATRGADLCNSGGSAESINSTEGVLYAEISALADDGTYRIFSINDGTTNERVYIQYTNASNTISVVVKNGNVTQANISHSLTDETQNTKVAFRYKANDFALYINGSQIGTDTSGTTPVGLDNFNFDQGNGANYFYGNVKQVAVFNEALSNTELATLTTL